MAITILGKSEATITMITDNLESKKWFSEIEIINNLKIPTTKEYKNSQFDYSEKYELNTKNRIFIIGATKPFNKKAIYEYFKIENSQFINAIHQSAQLSSTIETGYGLIINSLVSVAAHTKIGNHVTINRNASVGHHTILKDFVTINPGCNIAGNCIIGEGTLIGMGTNVKDGIEIGKNCIIGMGSLVNKDVPDGEVWWGNPAKYVKLNDLCVQNKNMTKN